GKLALVSDTGKLLVLDKTGKVDTELTLNFGDSPKSLAATVSGSRIFVFSYHPDGNGYVFLIDMKHKRLLAKANALDAPVRSLIPWGRTIFLDAEDGNLYAFRLDRSGRPKRHVVPPSEFAAELITKATASATTTQPGLARKLAGLGPKALGPMNQQGLTSENPFVVDATARAIALLGERKSVPALMKALEVQRQKPPRHVVDPVIPIINALAQIRDGHATKTLTAVLDDAAQSHERRRAAYVALGAIGTPAALQPIWRYRAAKALNTMTWTP
ncbi:MAG: HEAT repeat domain-containing protein, partial [Deltaproteobacteria bacterium]|nr:HEAT repeat domain-containing protein [Deltaproteobacteria bacterium]